MLIGTDGAAAHQTLPGVPMAGVRIAGSSVAQWEWSCSKHPPKIGSHLKKTKKHTLG